MQLYKHFIGEKDSIGMNVMIKSLITDQAPKLHKNSSHGSLNDEVLVVKNLDTDSLNDLKDIIESVSADISRSSYSHKTNSDDELYLDDNQNVEMNNSFSFSLRSQSFTKSDSIDFNNLFSLKNIKVSIDQIEEINEKTFVFVIDVWDTKEQAKINEDGQLCPTWSVKRKYDEFYVLDTRLKEFHKTLEKNEIHLPSKQMNLFRGSKFKQYLISIRGELARYLQSLLNNPTLSLSELIRSFLDPQSTEFDSSIFNDISNIGKKVKEVPLKLRLEVCIFLNIQMHKFQFLIS